MRDELRIRLVTTLVVLGTFVLGGVAGVGMCRWLMPRDEPPPPMHLPLRELDLTPEQDRQAREITERHREELESILRETYPKVRAVNDRIKEELRTILTPEQQRRLDSMKPRGPGPGPRGPGGPGGPDRGPPFGPGGPPPPPPGDRRPPPPPD